MPYKLTKRVQHRVEIAADLDPEIVNKAREGVLKKLARKVAMPGFRPGRAPLAIINARFADEIRAELLESLSAQAWEEVLRGEPNLNPVADPELTDIALNDDGSFTLTAEIDVRPRVELPDLDGLTMPEIDAEVTEAEVDAEVEKLRKEQATWVPADEQPAEDGVRVECSFRGVYVGEDDEPLAGEDGEPSLLVDEKTASFIVGHPDLYPEINEAMQGASTGDQKVAIKRFDDDDPDQARAGKRVRFDIEITSLKREELPAVDDELATAVGLESLEQLRERISEALTQNKERERRNTQRRALLDQLGSAFDLNELPQSLVQNAVANEMDRFERAFASQNQGEANFDRQELATRFEPHARKTVLDVLILEQLAEEWALNPDEQVDLVIRADAQQRGLPPAEHKANLKKEGQLAGLRQMARLSMATDELIRRVGEEVEPRTCPM